MIKSWIIPIKGTSGFRKQVGGSTCCDLLLCPARKPIWGEQCPRSAVGGRDQHLQARDFPASRAKRNEFLLIIICPGIDTLFQQKLGGIITLFTYGLLLIIQLSFLPLPDTFRIPSSVLLSYMLNSGFPLSSPETLVLRTRKTSQSFMLHMLFAVFKWSWTFWF